MATEGQVTEAQIPGDKRLTWDDIPLPILKLVLAKWRHVLQRGAWWDSIWLECGLCRYMIARYNDPKNPDESKKCELCPAAVEPEDWCNCSPLTSRLAIYRHPDRDTSLWIADVRQFVDMIAAKVASREKVETTEAEQIAPKIEIKTVEKDQRPSKPKKKGWSLFGRK